MTCIIHNPISIEKEQIGNKNDIILKDVKLPSLWAFSDILVKSNVSTKPGGYENVVAAKKAPFSLSLYE